MGDDTLRGMKAICQFMGYSESQILQWMRQYENFPVRKNGERRQGSLHSSKAALQKWKLWWLAQR